MNNLALAAVTATAASTLYIMRNPESFNYVTNHLTVNDIISGVMKLCLEYAVNNEDVDPYVGSYIHKDDDPDSWSDNVQQRINNFVQNAEITMPKWYKRCGERFQKDYKNLDPTNLMEIITKVTDIRQEADDALRKKRGTY